MSFQAIRSIILLLATTSMVKATPAGNSSDVSAIAAALGVTALDITKLNASNDPASFDPMPWTHPIPSAPSVSNPAEWPQDVKAAFMVNIKDVVTNALNTPSNGALSKREVGAISNAARAQAKAEVAKAQAERDSNASNRRKILTCKSTARFDCNLCAFGCGASWAGNAALCTGVALSAETGSKGFLTVQVTLALVSCLGEATKSFTECIQGCIDHP